MESFLIAGTVMAVLAATIITILAINSKLFAEQKLRLALQNELDLKGIIEKVKEENTNLILNHQQAVISARADAVVKSKAVTRGQIVESFIPFTIGNLNPRDFKHLGDPIDYIVFSGVYNSRHSEPVVDEILFVEVKTNKSRLSKVQLAIREAIKNNRVRFLTINPDKDIRREINEEVTRSDNS